MKTSTLPITLAEFEQLIADRWPGRTAHVNFLGAFVTLLIQPDQIGGKPEGLEAGSLEQIGELLKAEKEARDSS